MQYQDSFYNVGQISDEVLRKLEESGLRMTVQRRHIIDILMKCNYTSPKEVWIEAREFVPDLGIATVYRLINRLEQIGVLSKARNLGMRPVEPQMGDITNGRGTVLASGDDVSLSEVVRLGLIARGIIGTNNVIQLSLVGDKVQVAVIR